MPLEQPTRIGCLRMILYSTLLMVHSASSACYFRDGVQADDYFQCPGADFCCSGTQYCQSDGICRDKNNHANGSLTYFPQDADPGPYNYTGLYQTPACINSDFSGCNTQCAPADASSFYYLWECDTTTKSYCCHVNSVNLDQGDCCSSGQFEIDSPGPAYTTATTTTSSSVVSSATSRSKVSPSPHRSNATTEPHTSSTSTTLHRSSSTTTPHQSNTMTTSHRSNTTITPNRSSTTTTPHTSSTNLSESVKIALGIGVPVLFFIILAFVIICTRQRQMNKRFRQQTQQHPYQEIRDNAAIRRSARVEIDGMQRNELPAHQRPIEAPVDSRHELY